MKRPDYRRRQHKVIFLHDNAPLHTAKRVKGTFETFSWEILADAAYSPDLALSDYHLFASLGHAFAEQRFTSYESVPECLDNWFDFKDEQFYWRGIQHFFQFKNILFVPMAQITFICSCVNRYSWWNKSCNTRFTQLSIEA